MTCEKAHPSPLQVSPYQKTMPDGQTVHPFDLMCCLRMRFNMYTSLDRLLRQIHVDPVQKAAVRMQLASLNTETERAYKYYRDGLRHWSSFVSVNEEGSFALCSPRFQKVSNSGH